MRKQIVLRPMSEAPKDREILALYRNTDCYGCPIAGKPDAGNFHPIAWIDRPWQEGFRPRWGMRWSEGFSTSLDSYEGWIDPVDLPAALTKKRHSVANSPSLESTDTLRE